MASWEYPEDETRCDVVEYFKRLFKAHDESGDYELIDAAIREDVEFGFGWHVLYGAYRNAKGAVLAVIIVLEDVEHMGDWRYMTGRNFHYRVFTENVEPFFHECPKRIFDLLTENDNPASRCWRNSVRRRLAEAA